MPERQRRGAADRVGGGPAPFRDGTDTGVLSPGIARRRLCGLFETLHAILIDERRRCSQGLVINYMDRCFGVEHLRSASRACGASPRTRRARATKGKSPPIKGKSPPERVSSARARSPVRRARGVHVAAALRSATSLLLQLVDVRTSCSGPSGSAANVVAPCGYVPKHELLKSPSYPPPSDPRASSRVCTRTWRPRPSGVALAEGAHGVPGGGGVAPDGRARRALFGKGTEKLPERVAHYLERERHERERSAGGGSRSARPGAGLSDANDAARRFLQSRGLEVRGGAAGSGVARPARPPPPPFTPSPSMTASIMEMGFSEAQARAALVAVRGRSIELAMDWLFSHPNEARIADEEAAAAAAAPPPAAAGGAGDAGAGGGAAAAVDGSGAAVDAAAAAVDVAATPAATAAATAGGARVARGSRDAPRRGRGRRAHARAPDVHARRGGGGR